MTYSVPSIVMVAVFVPLFTVVFADTSGMLFSENTLPFLLVMLGDCETPVAACSGWADPVAGFYAEH